MYTQTRYATDFFRSHLPFTDMKHNDALTSSPSDYVLAKPGQVYAVYLPAGGTTDLNLSGVSGNFAVQWFDPASGGALRAGSVASIAGGGSRNIGHAPFTGDAVAVIKAGGKITDETTFPIRINSGGGSYTDPQGNVWSADQNFSGGAVYATAKPITNTSSGKLYQSERYNSGNVSYNFAVPNRTYTVTLKFAEIYFTSPKSRVFHIALNGQTVQANFDIAEAAGGANRAIDRTFTVPVTNGQLVIQLIPVIENAKLSAIEIR
jgi:hypothetical protein